MTCKDEGSISEETDALIDGLFGSNSLRYSDSYRFDNYLAESTDIKNQDEATVKFNNTIKVSFPEGFDTVLKNYSDKTRRKFKLIIDTAIKYSEEEFENHIEANRLVKMMQILNKHGIDFDSKSFSEMFCRNEPLDMFFKVSDDASGIVNDLSRNYGITKIEAASVLVNNAFNSSMIIRNHIFGKKINIFTMSLEKGIDPPNTNKTISVLQTLNNVIKTSFPNTKHRVVSIINNIIMKNDREDCLEIESLLWVARQMKMYGMIKEALPENPFIDDVKNKEKKIKTHIRDLRNKVIHCIVNTSEFTEEFKKEMRTSIKKLEVLRKDYGHILKFNKELKELKLKWGELMKMKKPILTASLLWKDGTGEYIYDPDEDKLTWLDKKCNIRKEDELDAKKREFLRNRISNKGFF